MLAFVVVLCFVVVFGFGWFSFGLLVVGLCDAGFLVLVCVCSACLVGGFVVWRFERVFCLVCCLGDFVFSFCMSLFWVDIWGIQIL